MTRPACNKNTRPQQPMWFRKNNPRSRLASNKSTRPPQPMWLRIRESNDQASVQQGHKATTTEWLRNEVSNGGIQQEHKATTTNVFKKNHPTSWLASNKITRPQQPTWPGKNQKSSNYLENHPMSGPASNKNTRPQHPIRLRNRSSNERACSQQGHKATTTKWSCPAQALVVFLK